MRDVVEEESGLVEIEREIKGKSQRGKNILGVTK